MYAVYLCGPTDCFLHAMFVEEDTAKKWAKENSGACDGYMIKFWENPTEIDHTDTGWEILK